MVSAVLFLSFGVSCLLAWLGQPFFFFFFFCHRHLWFVLSLPEAFVSFFLLPQAYVVCSFFHCHRHLWFVFSLSQAYVVCSFFLYHRHLWFVLCHRHFCVVPFTAFSAIGIHVRLSHCQVLLFPFRCSLSRSSSSNGTGTGTASSDDGGGGGQSYMSALVLCAQIGKIRQIPL